MQFKSLTFLAAVNYALAVTMVSVSDNEALNNKGLSSIHEGAGINYFFLNSDGPQAEDFTYDEAKSQLSTQLGNIPATVGLEGSILVNGVLGPAEIKEQDGVLSFNGTTQFYGCKNVQDPYRYSQESYMVVTDNSKGDCVPIQIKFADEEDASSSMPSMTSSITSAAPSHSGYANTTLTESHATTTTINTCDEECTKSPEPPVVPSSTFDGGANAGRVGLTGLAVAAAFLL